MVYLLQMVIFHGKMLNNEMVNGFYHGYHPDLDRTATTVVILIQLEAELNPNELGEFSLKLVFFLHSTFDYFSLWLQDF